MISLHRYKVLLREPQIAGTVGASVVGRLPIGMAVISILLFVQHVDQSFARAGVASALYVTGVGLVAPLVGRLIDRFGPRPLLYLGAVAYPVALFALIAAVRAGASAVWIGMFALLAGAVVPPIPTCVRALLRRLLHDGSHLQTAYSLDSVLMELVFIVGPGVVSVFAAAGWQAGAVACTALFGCVGTIIFARSAAVRGWEGQSQAGHLPRLTVLSAKGLRPILGATLFFSIGFGLFEVAVTAVAARAGVPAAAGVILALASVGSAAGALVYGSRGWPLGIAGQYKAAMVAMAIGLIALAPIENLYLFGFVSILAGAPMSTVLAAQSILIAGIAPRVALAESFTWSSTSLLAGVSIGIAAGGMMLERFAPSGALFAAGLATAVGTLVAFLGVRAPTSPRPLG